MRENGLKIESKAKEYPTIIMEITIKAIGIMATGMLKANRYSQMEIYIKAIGPGIKGRERYIYIYIYCTYHNHKHFIYAIINEGGRIVV